MILKIGTPPLESVQAFAKGLSILPGSGKMVENLSRDASSINEHHPHEMFFSGLTDISAGKVIESCSSTGWRYIVQLDDETYHSVEVNSLDGDNHEFAEINMGPFPKATQDMLALLEKDSSLAEDVYTVSALRIPALYVFALWLKEENSKNDLFIPLDPTIPDLEAGKKYTPTEFFSILKPLAEQRLKSDL